MQMAAPGSMTAAPEQLADRAIFYKHQDADLYPTLTYVLGRTIALVPQVDHNMLYHCVM